MKILIDCWDSLGVLDCQYGAHVLSGNEFSIYVNNWLFVSEDLKPLFSRSNGVGCVGHCILKFLDVSLVEFETSIFSRSEDCVTWTPPISSKVMCAGTGGTEYAFSGSLKGFQSSVEFLVNAASFELHVLQQDEPAKE